MSKIELPVIKEKQVVFSREPLCPCCREQKVSEPHSMAILNGGTLQPVGDDRYSMAADMEISGPYECQAGQIAAQAYSGQWPITGQLDPDTGILIWDSDQYEMIQENGFRRRVSVLFWRAYDKISRFLFGGGDSAAPLSPTAPPLRLPTPQPTDTPTPSP